jgi:hypothetical protein
MNFWECTRLMLGELSGKTQVAMGDVSRVELSEKRWMRIKKGCAWVDDPFTDHGRHSNTAWPELQVGCKMFIRGELQVA